jgi:hypothetical protein
MKQRLLLAALITLMCVSTASAFHPLVTDDTGTEGKGNWKVKINGKYEHDNEGGQEASTTKITTSILYGVTDTVDIEIGQPYKFKREKSNGIVSKSDGLSDTEFELKWRFYERDNLSFALRPSLTLPTGDDKKGLGNGKATYALFLLSTKEIEPWAVHFNVGYERNENRADERLDLWHLSAAAEYEAVKGFKLVGELGIDRNADKASNTHPAYTTVGIIYTLAKNIKVDLGVRLGLNKVTPDYAILPGIKINF